MFQEIFHTFKFDGNNQIDKIIDPREPLGLLLGNSGTGKSSIIHNLHGEPEIADSRIFKISQNASTFRLMDCTPADKNQTLTSVEELRRCLTAYPVNTVFFTIKLDSRFERMISEFI